VSRRELETNAIVGRLKPLGLSIKLVPADGNCLFKVRLRGGA